MRTRPTVGIALIAMALASCGGSTSGDSKTSGAASRPEAGAPAASQAAGATRPGRDVSTLKACEIVTPQEAAGIIGGKLLNEPPAGFANCAYVVEVGGGTESYRLMFAEAGLYAATFSLPDFKEKAERLTGLWDEAYVHPREFGTGFSVIAVRRGDVALEVNGERKDPAVAIARLAASRVRVP